MVQLQSRRQTRLAASLDHVSGWARQIRTPNVDSSQVIAKNEKVAVVGDGKLGLLAAQLVAVNVTTEPLHIGRHQEKLALVKGTRPILLEANGELPDKEKQVALGYETPCSLFTVLQKLLSAFSAACYCNGDRLTYIAGLLPIICALSLGIITDCYSGTRGNICDRLMMW